MNYLRFRARTHVEGQNLLPTRYDRAPRKMLKSFSTAPLLLGCSSETGLHLVVRVVLVTAYGPTQLPLPPRERQAQKKEGGLVTSTLIFRSTVSYVSYYMMIRTEYCWMRAALSTASVELTMGRSF